jgi:hypothetical protein
MITLRRTFVLGVAALTVAAGLSGGLPATVAHADPVSTTVPATASVGDGMPGQAQVDLAATDPANSMHSPGWADVPGGVAARPYVSELTVINGGTTNPVITSGDTTPPTTSTGGVTAVVSPFNLCQAGQTPAQGVCYTTPNRVGLTVGYATNSGMGYNFADPSVAVNPTVDANTVIDMTVALNTLGSSLRWTWVNGDLLYWQTTNLGHNNAAVHIRFRPGTAPYVAQFPASNGCTATPMRDCDIPRADGQVLTASMVFSLDDTLDPALTGAAFATQNAIAGLLAPGGTQAAPTLDIQASSTHTKADGSPQLGTVQAFLPAAALLNLYGIVPGDAGTAFTTTRTGDAGTNNAPTYTPWTAAANGSDGLLVTVTGITFSVPTYKVAGRLRAVRSQARVRRNKTTLTATVPGCTRKSNCLVTVYDLGPQRSARFVATQRTALANQRLKSAGLSLTTPVSRLRKGDRYLLVVHSTKTGRLLVSTAGTVR